MKQKNFKGAIEIPAGIELKVDGSKVTLKGKLGEVTKVFSMPAFRFSREGAMLVVSCDKYGIYDHEKFMTVKAHLRNMIKGCNEGYLYKLKTCSAHFPMNVSVSGNKFVVKNMLGEKVPRELVIKPGVKVEVKADMVEVSGLNKETVSQVAADIEKLTNVTNRDRRIFQDGIYITSKDGQGV
jgi:large subunit ribosomal protein L6